MAKTRNDAYRCIAPLCKPLECIGCNCAIPADVYAVLMRAERAATLADENEKLRDVLHRMLEAPTTQISVTWKDEVRQALSERGFPAGFVARR